MTSSCCANLFVPFKSAQQAKQDNRTTFSTHSETTTEKDGDQPRNVASVLTTTSSDFSASIQHSVGYVEATANVYGQG